MLLCGLALTSLGPLWFSLADRLWELTAARAVGEGALREVDA